MKNNILDNNISMDKKKVKVQVKTKGSLYHYAHFLCDCLFPEVCLKLYDYDEVARQKHIKQTLGNFSKIYEDVMKTSYKEISPKIFESYEARRFVVDKSKFKKPEEFFGFRDFILRRYNIERDFNYPEVLLIERGERKELISDPEMRKNNKNVSTGKERREIEEIGELKKWMSDYFGVKYRCVILENLPFNEQVRLFYNANFIVAMHGAALSNMFFCRQKTKVLEVLGEREWNFFNVISQNMRLNHNKCDNNLEVLKNEIIRLFNFKDLTKEQVLDLVLDKIKSKRIEISKNSSNDEVPTIYYIGMEKTASKSLLFGFTNNMVAHWHSLEYFEMRYGTHLLSNNELDLYDLAIYAGKKHNFIPLIVESIREPISQLVSAIIQHFKKFNVTNCKCKYCMNMGENENFIKLVKENITKDNWLSFRSRGFQSIKMWNKHFGIDLLKVFKQNNCYYELPHVKVLLLRLEDAHKRKLLFEKIGYSYDETYSNLTENNPKVANIYRYVNENLRFTKGELDEIYKDEVRIFYKEDEINRFRGHWIKKN